MWKRFAHQLSNPFLPQGEVSHLPVIRAEGCGLCRKTSIRRKKNCRVGKVSRKQGGKDENFFRRTRVKNPPTQPLRWKTFRRKHKHGRFTKKVCVWKTGQHAHEQKPDVVVNYQQTKQQKGCFLFFALYLLRVQIRESFSRETRNLFSTPQQRM